MKLTETQRTILSGMNSEDQASAFQLGYRTQIFGVLLRKGLIEQVRTSCDTWDRFSMFRITPEGRAALQEVQE